MRSSMMSRRNSSRLSTRLILSYVFDWVAILAAGAAATAFSVISPNKRPFSLGNPEISYPHTAGTVSGAVLILCGMAAPAIIIVIVCLTLVPGPSVPKSVPKSLIWKRKLWEWFTGWLGLGMSCSATWVITSGLKNLVGKPRPDLIARCQPDLAKFADYVLTGFPTTPSQSALVSGAICQQTDMALLDDGWRSFPSGHSSFSAAGLVYLSLFLASKLAITLPFLSPKTDAQSTHSFYTAFPSRSAPLPPVLPFPLKDASDSSHPLGTRSTLSTPPTAARNQAASPPVFLLVLAFVPTGAAMYIAATRYDDYRHHGFDILSGFFIGTVTAVFAFRYYHLPVSRGAGWSWGPRSRSRAFWAGVGTGGYVGDDDDEGDARGRADSNAVMLADVEAGLPEEDEGQQRPGRRGGPAGGAHAGEERDTDEFELLERRDEGGEGYDGGGGARRYGDESGEGEGEGGYRGARGMGMEDQGLGVAR